MKGMISTTDLGESKPFGFLLLADDARPKNRVVLEHMARELEVEILGASTVARIAILRGHDRNLAAMERVGRSLDRYIVITDLLRPLVKGLRAPHVLAHEVLELLAQRGPLLFDDLVEEIVIRSRAAKRGTPPPSVRHVLEAMGMLVAHGAGGVLHTVCYATPAGIDACPRVVELREAFEAAAAKGAPR